jgi:hypothetical protein
MTRVVHERRASEKTTMTKRKDEPRDSDAAIWKDAMTLSAAETKDARVHLTLRLNASLYRSILEEKKLRRDGTVTATVERLLYQGLSAEQSTANSAMLRALRNMIAHGIAQDAILVLLARNLKLHSAEEKRLFETFQAHFAERDPFKVWLSADYLETVANAEPSAREELIKAVFDPASLENAS